MVIHLLSGSSFLILLSLSLALTESESVSTLDTVSSSHDSFPVKLLTEEELEQLSKLPLLIDKLSSNHLLSSQIGAGNCVTLYMFPVISLVISPRVVSFPHIFQSNSLSGLSHQKLCSTFHL